MEVYFLSEAFEENLICQIMLPVRGICLGRIKHAMVVGSVTDDQGRNKLAFLVVYARTAALICTLLVCNGVVSVY